MMEITDDLLSEITGFAESFTSPADIALITGIDSEYLFGQLKIPDSKIRIAFNKGKLLSEAKLRKSIISIACQGSSPAQTLAIKLRDEMNMSMLKHKL